MTEDSIERFLAPGVREVRVGGAVVGSTRADVSQAAYERYVAARARLNRHKWVCVKEGMDGLGAWEHRARKLGMIHSIAVEQDGEIWEHVSVSRYDDTLPTWEQTRDVFHEVAGPDALGVIVVPPKSEHVNIGEVTHIFHCLTRRPLPDFTRGLKTI